MFAYKSNARSWSNYLILVKKSQNILILFSEKRKNIIPRWDSFDISEWILRKSCFMVCPNTWVITKISMKIKYKKARKMSSPFPPSVKNSERSKILFYLQTKCFFHLQSKFCCILRMAEKNVVSASETKNLIGYNVGNL